MARKPDRRGKEERRRSKLGRIRRPFLEKFYNRTLDGITPGDFEFSLHLLPAEGVRPVRLDSAVESFGWSEDSDVMTGTLELHRPDPTRPRSLPIAAGMRVRCLCRWSGRRKWYVLWTMRVPEPDVDAMAGSLSVELEDDLGALKRNKRKWSFRATKEKAYWTVDEIFAHVARKEGIRLGRVIKGQARIKKLELEGHGLALLRKALEKEKERTGGRYIIRLRNGLLECVPYRRNPVLYVLGRQLTGVNLSGTRRRRPVTAIIAKGRIGKGSEAKKVGAEIYDPGVVRRWGYVSKEKNYGQVDSKAELEKLAKRDLADALRSRRTLEAQFPGIPFIRRGDGCRWLNHEPGWHGPSRQSRDRTFIYCDAISNSVGPSGEYTSSGTFIQEDPYVADAVKTYRRIRKERRAARKRAAA